MKSVIKNERGVTLISLAVAIIILGIITSMLIYNVKDTKDIERVSNMYMDIEGISDRVSNYYSRYGALPVRRDIDLSTDSTISEWVSELNSANNEGPLGANDTGNFYVIDMNALENLSLNYGVGYEKLSEDPENKDLYVINENSHNIFYLHGIKVNNNGNIKMYYTNQDKDTEVVDIRYKDGIRIPDGFNLVSGNTKNDLVIKNGSDDEYKWANTVDNQYIMTTDNTNYYLASATAPETKKQIVLGTGQTVEDLILSAKEFGGFYFTPTDLSANISVNYFSVAEEDNWGMPYDVTATYTDKNGDKAYIPAGFKISKLSSLNTIRNGLVIKKEISQERIDAGETGNGDEYVWIDVPDSVLENARTLEEIENALKEYAKDYRKEGDEDEWYDGCGIPNKTQYNNLKNTMLQSIKENGGFYIGRYEAGVSKTNPRTSGTSATSVDSLISESGVPTSQKDKYPYNYVTVAQAQGLSQRLKPTGADYETSLMFGLQWNLVCKFIEETGAKTYSEIAEDSASWGNFSSAPPFELKSGKYATEASWTFNSNWTDYTTSTTGYVENKIKLRQNQMGKGVVCTTGISDKNKVLNIYDFAGNVNEFVMAYSASNNSIYIRGGSFVFILPGNRASHYEKVSYDWKSYQGGFRVTIFTNPTQSTTQQ